MNEWIVFSLSLHMHRYMYIFMYIGIDIHTETYTMHNNIHIIHNLNIQYINICMNKYIDTAEKST
jgi:hypothetical protein